MAWTRCGARRRDNLRTAFANAVFLGRFGVVFLLRLFGVDFARRFGVFFLLRLFGVDFVRRFGADLLVRAMRIDWRGECCQLCVNSH